MSYTEVINSSAPIRVCDNGGWTDTWFAKHGAVFNIGVLPAAEVQIKVGPRQDHEAQITLFAENFDDRYSVTQESGDWLRHPLLEAAIDSMPIPNDAGLDITVYCEAPAGASTGTSAAVTVALLAALDRLTPGRLSPHEIAHRAQRVESERLSLQSGIQDQLCSAYGGINYIEMHDYPYATVSPIVVRDSVWWELQRRLVLVFLGNSHNSSQVHELVIAELEDSGPDEPRLQRLRETPAQSRDAIYAGDFDALGRAMIANTEAQAALHPALVSRDAEEVIGLARAFGAVGWKVNGAGGAGGSLTLLCGGYSHDKRAMIAAIEAANPLFRTIPITLSRGGVRTWRQPL